MCNEPVKKKELWIDILKGFGILLVLYGHVSPPGKNYIYAFHMPLFFLISGYLFKEKKDIKDYSIKLFKRYIIPYFILAFLNLVIAILSGEIKLVGHYILGIVYSRGTTEWMPHCSPLWFLTCISIALFIYNLIKQIENKKIRITLIVGCMLISYLLDKLNCPKLIWNIDTALMAVFYLEIGNLFYRNKGKELNLITVIILLALGIIAAYFNKSIDFDENKYGNIIFMLIASISLSIVVMALIYRFQPLSTILSFFGKHTMFIMGFDYFSGAVARLFVRNFLLEFILKVIIITIGILIWSWIISKIPNENLKKVLSL